MLLVRLCPVSGYEHLGTLKVFVAVSCGQSQLGGELYYDVGYCATLFATEATQWIFPRERGAIDDDDFAVANSRVEELLLHRWYNCEVAKLCARLHFVAKLSVVELVEPYAPTERASDLGSGLSLDVIEQLFDFVNAHVTAERYLYCGEHVAWHNGKH